MRLRVSGVLSSIAAAGLFLAACTPAAPPAPTAAPAKPASAPPAPAAKPTTAPAKPTAAPAAKPTEAAKPAATTAPAAKPTEAAKSAAAPTTAAAKPTALAQPQPKPISQAESDRVWNELAAAARPEGKVVIMTNTTGVRDTMAPHFQERFGIEAEVLISRTGAQRISEERAAGAVGIDFFLSGLNSMGNVLMPQGALAPVKPLLVHPDVTDPGRWRDGLIKFADPEGMYVLTTLESANNQVTINTQYVNPAELRVSDDLLNPKWKGKISSHGVGNFSPGDNAWIFYMLQKGDDWIRKLYAQELFITDENRIIADNMARGSYPISLTLGEQEIMFLREQGFPIEVIWWEDLPRQAGGGGTYMGVIAGAPHPNALKLWVNWFASQEGQTMYSAAAAQPSRRVDVPPGTVPAFSVLRAGERTYDSASWDLNVVNSQTYAQRLNAALGILPKP
jgi:ABC-type Fe3+ transport system substrate-binding protein